MPYCDFCSVYVDGDRYCEECKTFTCEDCGVVNLPYTHIREDHKKEVELK